MKRSITIAGHRTSVWLEEPFWQALGEIAAEQGVSGAALIAEIDGKARRRRQPVVGDQDLRAGMVPRAADSAVKLSAMAAS